MEGDCSDDSVCRVVRRGGSAEHRVYGDIGDERNWNTALWDVPRDGGRHFDGAQPNDGIPLGSQAVWSEGDRKAECE